MKWGLRSMLCLAAASVAGASVIGIDFGSSYMKVALVQLKVPLEIVPNTISKRKTEIAVAFDRGERMFGSDAVGMLSRKPGMAYAHFREMMGRAESHPLAAAVKEMRYGTEATMNATRGGLEYRYKADDNLGAFSAEELAAMVLTYARDITKDFGGLAVRDCVITVPAFATAMERRAIIAAADIAGLKVLSLIEDNTAAALQYGKDNVFDDKTVLYYNMGAGSTQVTIAKYSNYTVKELGKNKTVGTFEVLAKTWDPTLGGEQIDKALMEHMAAGFAAKAGSQEVYDSNKAMAKLRAQATKTKTVLSANSEIKVKVNSVLSDTDYSADMKRADLEELVKPLLDRTTAPIQQALDFANLTAADVDAVEMLGGGQRVPGVQKALAAFLGADTELGVHLNADEATALGAAFAAANISTQFKVRKTGMADHSPWAVDVALASLPLSEADAKKAAEGAGLLGGLFGGSSGKKLSADEAAAAEAEAAAWKKSTTVYKAWSKLDTKKVIAFHHDRDIACGVSYATEQAVALPPGTPAYVAAYNVTGVAAFAASLAEKGLAGCGPDLNPKPKVTLHFKLDASGLVSLAKAEATCEQPPKPEEAAEAEAAAEKAAQGDEEAKKDDGETKEDETKEDETKEDDEEEESKDDEPKEEGADDAAAEKTEGDEEKELSEEEKAAAKEAKKAAKKAEKKAKKEAEAAAKKAKKEKAKKEKPVKADLEVVEDFSAPEVKALSPDAVAASKARLAYLQALDDARRLKLEAKNGLEAYLYATKNKVEDDAESVDQVTTEEQRDALVALCREYLDWLDEDGFDATAEAYGSKKVDVEDLAEPIFFRAAELSARPEAVAMAEKRLKDIKLLVAKWETTMPQVTEAERDSVVALVDKAKAWLDEKVAAQDAATLVEAPKFTAAEVAAQLKPTASLVTKLSRKPKPKPKAVVNATNATEAANATAGAANATEAEEAGAGENATDAPASEEGTAAEEGDAKSTGAEDDEL